MKTHLLPALFRSLRPRTGRQKYLQEGMIPFGLNHFFFESCHVFAQRVDNALVSLFSLARALQLPRIKRLSEGDPDFPETRQDSADGQGLVCSRDEHRYNRDRETRNHDTDSRLEWLKLSCARKPALGEPDNTQLTLQQYGAECETGDSAALGVDRHGIGQTADEPRKHVARYDDAPSSPVSSRQAGITQNSAKGGRIKIAGVIRREYKLGVFRETIEAPGFDPEEPAHNGSIGKKQNARYQPHHETGRFQPALLLVRQDLLWTIERLGF